MENPRKHEISSENTEYWQNSFRFTFALAIIILLTTLIWKRWNFVAKVNKLPMWRLRFYHLLGHLHYILHTRYKKKTLSQHVYDFIYLNAYWYPLRNHSIVAIWAPFVPIIQIQRADAVKTILSSSVEVEKAWPYKFFHPWLGNGLLTSPASEWRKRRKLLTPAFHFQILRDFFPVFNKQSKVLVNILSNYAIEEFVDIVPLITRCSFDIICESVLGVAMQTQTNPSCSYLHSVTCINEALFERLLNPLLWPDFIFKMSPLGRKFQKNVKLVHDFNYQLITEKKKRLSTTPTVTKNDDGYATRQKRALLDLLLDEHMNNSTLTETDVREEVETFTFAGHDTTSMALSFTLYLIGLHPGVQEKIHEELDSLFGDSDRDITPDDLKEMKYLECVLKESMRLYPPVPFLARDLKQDMEFQGSLVPAGTTCAVSSYCLHRDADAFPNPEIFDPERFYPENSVGRHPFAYIPFSAGPRNCIGQKFALMEMSTLIANLLRKFKLRSLDPRDKIHLLSEVVLRPAEKLRIEVRFRDYKPEKTPIFYY